MDDFEKKDFGEIEDPTAEPETDEAKSPTEVEDNLVKELEGIRDLLQTELDSASEAEESFDEAEGELIQELDEIQDEDEESENEEPKKEKRICECCGEKECDDSYGEDYPYCSDCRKLMTASPAHVGGIVMLVVMIVAIGASLFFCAKNTSDYMTLIEAETAYSQKKLIDAATTYNTYLQGKNSSDDVSMKAVRNLIKAFASMGYYSDASTLISTYGESHPSLLKNKEFSKIPGTYASFLASSTAVNEAIGDVINSGEKFDYEEKAALLDKILEKKQDDEGTPYSEVFVEYYKFVLMSVANMDTDKQLEQLLKVKELDNGENPWVYMPNLVNVYAKMGDSENAGIYFEECMKINIQESELYTVYANSYRFSDSTDNEKTAEEMIKIADRAKESWPSNAAPSYQEIYALAYLFQGKGEEAMKAIEEYVGNGNYSVSACNLYAVCSINVGDEDGYKKMVDVFESASRTIGSTVKKYKNGKMTLEEVLKDKGGDI